MIFDVAYVVFALLVCVATAVWLAGDRRNNNAEIGIIALCVGLAWPLVLVIAGIVGTCWCIGRLGRWLRPR